MRSQNDDGFEALLSLGMTIPWRRRRGKAIRGAGVRWKGESLELLFAPVMSVVVQDDVRFPALLEYLKMQSAF